MTHIPWLADYIEFTKHQESPEEFHIWTGLTTIAAALGRKCWMDRRAQGVTYYKIYPGQLMVVLTAGSGLVRKSTAIAQAKKFLKHINKPTVGGKSSVEAFLKQFISITGGVNSVMLYEGELTSFINKASYLDPLIEVVIKLADAEDEFEYNTIAHGKILIKEPCLTLLSCTTPESLGARLPTSAHGAGFMSRVIFVYAKSTDRRADLSDVGDEDINPEQMKEANERLQRLLDGITKIGFMSGPFTFTPGGRKWFRDYYNTWVSSVEGQGEGYPARKPDHLLRVAMCFAASKSNSLQLDEHSLSAAKFLLSRAERDFDKAFAFVGTTYTKDRQRIIDFIATRGGECSNKELYSAMYAYFKDSETLKRTLTLLKEAGIIIQFITQTQPPIECWRLSGAEFKI